MFKLVIEDLEVNEVVNSIGEAREKVYDLIDQHDLDASTWDWAGSHLLKENEVIGRVSFNGRIWDKAGNEILD